MNIRKKIWVPAAVAGIFSIILSATALAQSGDRFSRYLDLTEEQQVSVEALRTEFKEDHQAAREVRKQIQELIASGNTDQAAEMAAEQARNGVYKRAEFRQRMAAILTPEQMEKFETAMEKRAERRGEGRRGRRGR